MVEPNQTTPNFNIPSKASIDEFLSLARQYTETVESPVDPAPVEDSPIDPPADRGSYAAAANPAVGQCCEARLRALNLARSKEKGQYAADKDAALAYRNAMPPLAGAGNIRDFIACVAHGMLIDAIAGPDGARLLYAAQVAQASLHKPSPNRAGRPASNS